MSKLGFRAFDYARDMIPVFNYMTENDSQKWFSHKFQIHNLPMFEQWISRKFSQNFYHDFFMIETISGKTIGFVYSYEFHELDAHCKMTLCLFEEYENNGYGAVAAIKMLNYLFETYPLKQVFTSVFDYNQKSLKLNKKGGFTEVGVLPKYRYWKGEYHDLHILSMTKEYFYERYSKIVTRKSNEK